MRVRVRVPISPDYKVFRDEWSGDAATLDGVRGTPVDVGRGGLPFLVFSWSYYP